jgi:hypothetical protein
MLSKREKSEMLEDAKSNARRKNFRFVREKMGHSISFEEYMRFLNEIQKAFAPLGPIKDITITKFNRL